MHAEALRYVPPRELERNPDNPRLIFRADDLKTLEDSIAARGILVPLTVYADGDHYYLLDGERRWRCAIRLNLATVPVIVQPKPGRMQNIMMMFAIHNARRDWDPLPTAYKLQDLENLFFESERRMPTEAELAELASLTRGMVRRLKKLLSLPQEYRDELLAELELPRPQQRLTVDHVLEATKGAEALAKRGVVDAAGEERLRRAIVDKFRTQTLNSTVEPRKLARLARAVERDEVSMDTARRVVERIVSDASYTIDDAFEETTAHADLLHSTSQLAERLASRLSEHLGGDVSPELMQSLRALRRIIDQLVQ
jgi:ParB/RepB/Spo0J family partition protein